MRPYNVYFLPDLRNNWHWHIFDARGIKIQSSDHGHFRLIDAQKEAEAVMHYSMAS